MKHLFSVRHGEFDYDEYILTSSAKSKLERLSLDIKNILSGESACLVTSVSKRAVDTTEIIMKSLGLSEYDREPYLWSANDAPQVYSTYNRQRNIETLSKIVEDRLSLSDSIIVVSHQGACEDLAKHYLKKFSIKCKLDDLSYGSAIHLDIHNKSYNILPLDVL